VLLLNPKKIPEPPRRIVLEIELQVDLPTNSLIVIALYFPSSDHGKLVLSPVIVLPTQELLIGDPLPGEEGNRPLLGLDEVVPDLEVPVLVGGYPG